MPISYLDGPRLRGASKAACLFAQRVKGELNRINVFPVPDGDTGTNLALTARAIATALGRNSDRGVGEVAQVMARAAVVGARGNCGMMLSQFLLGFARRLDGRKRVSTVELAEALMAGAEALEDSLDNPVEGTILTVMRDTAAAAIGSAAIGSAAIGSRTIGPGARGSAALDYRVFMRQITAEARESVRRTPELLPALEEAGVVDAGAKGFLSLLEGALAYAEEGAALDLSSDDDSADPAWASEEPSPVALHSFSAEMEAFRFCTEGLVEGGVLPSEEVVKDGLRHLGEELLVIRTEGVLKVHLHTNDPEAAFAYLRGIGTLVSHKAEDMWLQHEAAREAHGGGVRRPLGIVVDSACDLPEAVVQGHGMHVVPLQLIDGSTVYRDRLDVSAVTFHQSLGHGTPMTTSQPTPGSFVDAFRSVSSESERVVGVLLAKSLSGTYGAADAATRLVEDLDVTLIDSRGASLLTGLLALKAAEMAEAGADASAIRDEVSRVRDQSNILFTVETLDRLIASGRVGRLGGWIGGLFDLKPILGLQKDGSVKAMGKARGSDRVRTLLFQRIREAIPRGVRSVRFGIVHVGAPDVIEPLGQLLRAEYGTDVEILTAAATPVIATHLGIGAWGIAYMVED